VRRGGRELSVQRTIPVLPTTLKPVGIKSDESVMDDNIRQVITEHARLPGEIDALSREDDLYEAGMTSHASVNVMLALEDRFDVEFPDRMLTRSAFASIAAIAAALAELQAGAPVQ
jgi:acyl carrier protein